MAISFSFVLLILYAGRRVIFYSEWNLIRYIIIRLRGAGVCKPRDKRYKVLSEYEIHMQLDPCCAQPKQYVWYLNEMISRFNIRSFSNRNSM